MGVRCERLSDVAGRLNHSTRLRRSRKLANAVERRDLGAHIDVAHTLYCTRKRPEPRGLPTIAKQSGLGLEVVRRHLA